MPGGFQKGLYIPRHPEKYKGNLKKIIFRSSWELDFCKFLDNNQRVLKWASEPFYIPYVKPTDKRVHKYYPDFWFEYITRHGEVVQEVVEIKPSTQISQPTVVGKKPKQQLYESITYAINVAKWKAATEFCAKYNMKFKLVTENTQFK